MRRLLTRIRTLAWLFTGLAIWTFALPAHAQESQRAWLSAIDTSQFPVISVTLDVRDPTGGFIHGLVPTDITLLENGQFAAVKQLSEVPTPLRFSVAINASPSMGIRSAAGIARYDLIAQALAGWAAGTGAETGDDYSLFTNGGPASTGLASPEKWVEAFQAYKADFRSSKPSLESLSGALNRETGLPSQPGLGRVILWITSPPEGSLLAEMGGLSERVQQSGVRLDIWSVSTAAAFNSQGSKALQQMAEATGGTFFAYSGAETFPDLSASLQPLRGIYQLSYVSNLRQAGEATLAAQVQQTEGTITSQPVSFNLDLQPPNPMLLSPPDQIVRTCPADARQPLEALTPITQVIRALVEFPDGHVRDLQATRLYVDGKLAGENLEAPFDQFDWDISEYTTSGAHALKVEVQDSLGLSRQSLEIPVDIQVVIPPADLGTTLARNNQYVTWGAIVLAALALILILYFAEKRGLFRAARREIGPAVIAGDPLLQPVLPGQEAAAGSTGAVVRARKGNRPSMDAQLVYIDMEGEPLPQPVINLSGREVIFGREPTGASCWLNDASVEALHARLAMDERGNYLLSDLNSIAGTWVNYAPVSMDGAHLEHGDIIHIGRVAFRFLLARPGKTRIPSVQPTPEGS